MSDIDTEEMRGELDGILQKGASPEAKEQVLEIFDKLAEAYFDAQSEIDDKVEEIETLENVDQPSKVAINEVLDLVERPLGTLRASLPQTDATERALIRLHDVVGRRL